MASSFLLLEGTDRTAALCCQHATCRGSLAARPPGISYRWQGTSASPRNSSDRFSCFRWQNRVLEALCTSELQNKQ